MISEGNRIEEKKSNQYFFDSLISNVKLIIRYCRPKKNRDVRFCLSASQMVV